MSGLLRRLARQATGQALPRAHAPARLPYQAAPDLLTEEVPRTATTPARQAPGVPDPASSPVVAAAESVTAPTTAGTTAPLAASIDTPLPAPLIEEVPPVDKNDMSDPTPADAVTPTTARTTPISPDAAPIAAQATPPGPEAASITPTTTAGEGETPDSPGTRLAQVKVASRVAATSPPAASTTDPATAASTPGTPPEPERQAPSSPPEALLPPLAERQPPPRSTAMPAPSLAAEGPAEVHVHIGRIEVTAVQEPAPTKRPSKRGPSPMSLDEYLARRRGSRP